MGKAARLASDDAAPGEVGNPLPELDELYERMLLIRRFEEKAAEMYARGKIGGFLHLAIGEEAVCVGAIAAIRPDDDVFTHYRDHGYALARELDPGRVMAELYGRATGTSGGKGGSMHLADVSKHFWGGYAIVALHLPLAVGMAWAHVHEGRGRIVLCTFGDGATNKGDFHEALNMAALWSLPVVFLCENNLYGMGTAVARASAVTEMHRKAAAYGMPGVAVDGMDVAAVHGAVREAAERARAGGGPTLIEARTYRFRGHSMADPESYRERREVEAWRLRDPVTAARKALLARPDGEVLVSAIESRVEEAVEASVRFAEESPEPEPAELWRHVTVTDDEREGLGR